MSKIKLTPAMRQYSEFKEQHPDSILFFRMGDFYEMFFDDAIIASNILGIALTSRDKEKQIPMCGIPYHAAKTYIPRLIKEGHKVSICDQVGEVGAGKIVDRAVTQVITPGTAMDDYGSYEGKSNSYIASVFRGNSVYGFSYMDLTTGEYKYTEVVSTQSVLDELSRLTVREVIIEEELYRSNFEAASLKIRFKMPYLSFVPREFFNEDPATNDHGGHSDDEVQTKLDLGSSTGTIAAKALINYVRTSCNIPLNNISSNLVKYNAEDYLYFDDKADSNLNIQSSADQSSTGTLLTLLDKTKSSLGGRRLRSWVARPLLDVAVITERHDAVEELYNDRVLLKKIQGMLGDVYDIERIMTRVELLRAAPVDLIQLARTLNIISKFKEELSRCSSERFQFISVNLVDLTELFKVLSEAIVDEFSEDDSDEKYIKKGYSRELDELRSASGNVGIRIKELEANEREVSGISSLKVRYNRVQGYYIEVTKTNLDKVPGNYIRKQTLVNAERFYTDELKALEKFMFDSSALVEELEQKIFVELLDKVKSNFDDLRLNAELISEIDVLASFAQASIQYDYVRPVVDNSNVIDIKAGRHPIVEASIKESFIDNDVFLSDKDNQIMILTGPNMAGKSTFIRQVALITIMAQLGCYVPAESARIGVVDRIFTRIGASDNIAGGLSTFMVEMVETADIVKNATRRSLVILDEVGRGTSTFDGVSIAFAITEYLHEKFDIETNEPVATKTMFATHYHELSSISDYMGRVVNYNIAVADDGDDVTFLHKVIPGVADKSYGIHVAEMAGLPKSIIKRANEILLDMEAEGSGINAREVVSRAIEIGEENGGKSPQYKGIIDELNGMNTNNLTPIEALNILNRMIKQLQDA